MKIYHYTKGCHLKSIFKDGFIATEQKRNTNYDAPFCTDLAWLTEGKTVPVTSLPYIPSVPSTDLTFRGSVRYIGTDYASIAPVIGGFFRFGFESSDNRFEKWVFSKARREVKNRRLLDCMEKIANKVGDNIRTFWISEKDVALNKFTLEGFSYSTNEWIRIDPDSIEFRDFPDGSGYKMMLYPYFRVPAENTARTICLV